MNDSALAGDTSRTLAQGWLAHNWMTASIVFLTAAAANLTVYIVGNDAFDRIARARQIAVYGDVPFRDFFDPGYFLALYSSALMQRVFGDSLLGECVLNITLIAAGTVLVFALAKRAGRSTTAGLVAAALVIAAQPRNYDYDKMFFYPMGLFACWNYIDRPTVRSLLFLSAVTVLAGMFRYDSAVYIGAGALVAIAATHRREWRVAARRIGFWCAAVLLMAAPALVFIQMTAGLRDAFTQILTYAQREGQRSQLFEPATFNLPLAGASVRGLGEALNLRNATTWLYYMAFGIPVATLLMVPRSSSNRAARLLSYAVITVLASVFTLRDPIAAHIPALVPLVAVGGTLVADQCIRQLRRGRGSAETAKIAHLLAGGAGLFVLTISIVSLVSLVELPRDYGLMFERVGRLRETPPSMDLLPKSDLQPIVEYFRDCTKPGDRVLVGWFAAEAYFFSGRGFAAGLPVVFFGHWKELSYQRRSIRLLEQQSVPIIVTRADSSLPALAVLWSYIQSHYEMVQRTTYGELEDVETWVRRGVPIERRYGESALPCYVPRRAGR